MTLNHPIEMIDVDLSVCDRDNHESCRICNEVDNLVCDRGRHCAGLRIGDIPAPIGFYLDGYADPEVCRSAYTFRFADTDEFLFCEDCAIDIAENGRSGVTDPIVTGAVDEFDWFVDVADGKFQAFVAVHGPDHGAVWEHEGGVFDTFTEAVDASRGWAQRAVTAIFVRDLRSTRRLRPNHPTDLAVPTTLTVDELDIVLGYFGDDDPTTVRSSLIEACRQLVGEMIADLIESEKIPNHDGMSHMVVH